jgi:hypothetical protein
MLKLRFQTIQTIQTTQTLHCVRQRLPKLQKRWNHFNSEHLQQCDANYAPLTPLTTFTRSALQSPTSPCYVYEGVTRTWGEVSQRVSQFAHALRELGVNRGDVVSIMCPNTPPIFESHFAVPGAGAVLHAVNTRLDAATIAYQLDHAGTKVGGVTYPYTLCNVYYVLYTIYTMYYCLPTRPRWHQGNVAHTCIHIPLYYHTLCTMYYK